MIPASNTDDLHLSSEVIDAVREGRFHVWAVDTVEDGIELLTGVEAGAWSDDEWWSEGSVYARCQDRLDEMVRLMRRSAKGATSNSNESNSVDEGADDEDPASEPKCCRQDRLR